MKTLSRLTDPESKSRLSASAVCEIFILASVPFRADASAINAIKFDYFGGGASIDQLVNGEMGMTSSAFYQSRSALDVGIG